ncbi:hypothetical protein DUNSADRAFT_3683, partial [Dunaliella salina]
MCWHAQDHAHARDCEGAGVNAFMCVRLMVQLRVSMRSIKITFTFSLRISCTSNSNTNSCTPSRSSFQNSMGRKRRQPAWMQDDSYECAGDGVQSKTAGAVGPAIAEPLQVAGTGGEDSLTPYEKERQLVIQRNKQRMLELGIPMAAQELSAISAKAKAAPKAPKPKPKDVKPAKRSKRISGERAPETSLPEGDEED